MLTGSTDYEKYDKRAMARNVMPSEDSRSNTSEMKQLLEYISRHNDDLLKTMTDELHGAHFKNAITKRNEWFVNNLDLLIAYVLHDKGGVAKCLSYATKNGIVIKNICK